MPTRNSGIKRSSAVPSFIDTKKYEKPVEYASTSGYSQEYVKDPSGRYTHAETHENYSLEEHYAENPGFRAIRGAPVGSIVVVDQPNTSWTRGIGEVPAHKEYYEVIQDTKTAKGYHIRATTDNRGYYFTTYGLDRYDDSRFPEGRYAGRIGTVKDIQSMFKYAERITIYTPKGEK